MAATNKTAVRLLTCAGIGILAFVGVARAQMPSVHPVAASGSLTPTPAVVAPARPAGEATQPAALPPAAAPPAAASNFSCTVSPEFARLGQPLRHVARRLAAGEPITIVAIGSSSTAGAGASSAAASYPSRLAAELKKRFPGRDITVLNRGVNGEESQQMLARFPTDVIAAHPDLVLWQVGTNSVLRDHSLKAHGILLREGIAQLRQTGADVVLIDMQFAPRVLEKAEAQGMEDQIALVAKEANVDLFNRFALMRNWHEVQHMPFDVFTAPDSLHMNDWGYACVAKFLAAGIAEAGSRPTATAATPAAR
jgi:acyl-CoA thioesterase I